MRRERELVRKKKGEPFGSPRVWRIPRAALPFRDLLHRYGQNGPKLVVPQVDSTSGLEVVDGAVASAITVRQVAEDPIFTRLKRLAGFLL